MRDSREVGDELNANKDEMRAIGPSEYVGYPEYRSIAQNVRQTENRGEAICRTPPDKKKKEVRSDAGFPRPLLLSRSIRRVKKATDWRASYWVVMCTSGSDIVGQQQPRGNMKGGLTLVRGAQLRDWASRRR